MPLQAPKGFEDKDVRSRVAGQICRWIDAVKSDPTRELRLARYRIAQQVIDDEITLSSLVFVKDIEPYQPDLIAQRVEGVVSSACGGYNGQKPYFVLKGGKSRKLREAREADTHLAMEADAFPLKIRDIGYSAAIWARGPFRTVYKTIYEGEEYSGERSGKIVFSGPTDEPIKPEDFFPYPTYCTDLHQCRMVGHRFRQARHEILSLMLEEGGYFDDVEYQGGAGSEPEHATEGSDDDAPEMYHVIVKLRNREYLKGKDGVEADYDAEDLEDAKKRPMRAYRATVLYDLQILLALEEYDLPECEYFAPAMKRDVGEFYSAHSVASRGLSAQTLYNDAVTGDVLAVVGAVKRPVLASGFVSDMDTVDLEFGALIGFKGNPQFFSPPIPGNVGNAMAGIADRMERVADGAMGQSQIAQGQLPDAQQTATASAGALQGTAKRDAEIQEVFNSEICRSVRFKATLIARNWKDFKKRWGDRLQTKSAKDWEERFEVGANGSGPSNNPQQKLAEIATIMDAAEKLQMPYIEDIDTVGPVSALSKAKLMQGVIDNSDTVSAMEDVIVEVARPQPEPPVPDQLYGALGPPGIGAMAGAGGIPPGVPEELLGGVDPGGLPPDVLLALLGELEAAGAGAPVQPALVGPGY